ncbi:hypothetical protein AX17_000962 [Amanita inopinata Kibby_2008]|nr:hypothetical protein AX17_000962 [Amanita inopinata Kibby_2008]
MSTVDRSVSRSPPRSPNGDDVDMDVDKNASAATKPAVDKSDVKVVIVNNLTRNVVESHLQTIFGFYGHVQKVDLPLFGKSGQNRGKAALEFVDASSARKAASHMDGGQLDGAILKVELSDLPIRTRSRSPRRVAAGPLLSRNGRDRDHFERGRFIVAAERGTPTVAESHSVVDLMAVVVCRGVMSTVP